MLKQRFPNFFQIILALRLGLRFKKMLYLPGRDAAEIAYCSPPKPLASFMKQKPAWNKTNEVFEILPLIIFIHHAGDMQTRSTPSTTDLI